MVTVPTSDDVLHALRGVIDPELGSDVVELGMVPAAEVRDDGTAVVTVALTTAGCPLRAQLQRDVRARVGSLPGVRDVRIEWTELDAEGKRRAMERARFNIAQREEQTSVGPRTRVIAISSGKGGVGKSSVTVNLAAALAARGLTVGVLDADIWGFSVPRMLGLDGPLEGRLDGDRKLMVPLERRVAGWFGGVGRRAVADRAFLRQMNMTIALALSRWLELAAEPEAEARMHTWLDEVERRAVRRRAEARAEAVRLARGCLDECGRRPHAVAQTTTFTSPSSTTTS